MNDLKLPVERLTDRGEAFDYEAGAAWWAAREPEGQSEPCEAEAPFRFRLEARRVGDDLLIEGTMEGRVGLRCSRCGKRYPHALREPYRLVLEPATGPTEMDPEGERGLVENGLCLGEDLEAGWYRGPLIRLDEFFGEVVALAMPIQPLCSESCPGICPHCGAARATEPTGTSGARATCDCEDEKIDSPFAVLAKLKGEQS